MTNYSPASIDGESVNAASVTSDGTVVAGPVRLRAVQWRNVATAGSVVLKNGSGGSTLLTIYTPAATHAGNSYMVIPGAGIEFASEIYADVTGVDGVTCIYAS